MKARDGAAKGTPALVWFRRDLRDEDHAALAAALGSHPEVHCVFLFDTDILGALEDRDDARVAFIWDCVRELQAALEAAGGGLHVRTGRAPDEIPRLAEELGVAAVYANRDYEPEAIARDDAVAAVLRESGIPFRTCKDQVIFELDEVLTKAGAPFSVFTPYRRAWLERLRPKHVASRDTGSRRTRLAGGGSALPALDELGFERAELPVPAGMSGAATLWKAFRERMSRYAKDRDFPSLEATSRLSAHLRFGTVSVRALVRAARAARGAGAETWLSELIWRDFYFAVLAARPDVVDHAWRRQYDALAWVDDEAAWDAWREGRTGYPLVDAAMRELAAQGTMHNRLRMVTASFLAKHLGIDWRRGERWFARRLLDYDLAANNGGWQWSASTGCDAQPWFRIFNPVLQSRRFDPEGEYIRRWVPELARVPAKDLHAPWEMPADRQRASGCIVGRDYPAPVVEHQEARRRALARYGALRDD